VNDLQHGDNCNSGQTIDFTHNCMVTDEFSQVGVLVGMGNSEMQMDEFYNTVRAIKSGFGNIPAWRVYRNGDVIEQCKQGINDNCDTASDATARIIISLFSASKNPSFSDGAKQRYHDLASALSNDMVTYEVKDQCLPTKFGTVCHWLAAGSRAAQGGIASTDFGYTGYYPDAIIAMLAACKQTGDSNYCGIAKDFALNYLQASNFDGSHFTTPPGRSFKWTLINGQPKAECTNTCSPVEWDSADAPRALGLCQANYYADQIGVDIGLNSYCKMWGERYMGNPNLAPIQFQPDGTQVSFQSGYFAQGLQALFQSGGNNPSLFVPTLDNALSHYSTSTGTWDHSACFGVYTQAFAVRALGFGIGRDETVFTEGIAIPLINTTVPIASGNVTPMDVSNTTIIPHASVNISNTTVIPTSVNSSNTTSLSAGTEGISSLKSSCEVQYGVCTPDSDVTTGTCRTIIWSTPRGPIQILGCAKGDAVEVYRQAYPDVKFNACLGSGCMDEMRGFDRFTPVYDPVTPPVNNTPPVINTTPINISPVNNTPQTINTTQVIIPPADNAPADQAVPANMSSDPPTSPISPIASMQVSCSSPVSTCWKISDTTDGDCRSLVYGTSFGNVKVLSCLKEDEYMEVYRQEAPENAEFTFCVDAGCVSKDQGFARIIRGSQARPEGMTSGPEPVVIPLTTATISTLPFTVKPEGTLVGDYMEGSSCRKVQYNTPFGWVEAKACAKDGGSYELYLLSEPNEGSVCIGDACVGKEGGFAAFTNS
jgi:hypothetical protein